MSRFLPQTEEGLREILDNLREAKDTMTQTEFNLAQQSVGINYEAACLLYSPMAEIARVPTTRFPDWFHNLLASGGVLQYQVNHLCMELRKIGMTPEHLDDFPVVQSQQAHQGVWFGDAVGYCEAVVVRTGCRGAYGRVAALSAPLADCQADGRAFVFGGCRARGR